MNLKGLTRKQPPNRRVIVATLPCVAGGIYFFGWRSLAVVLTTCAIGFGAEWLFCRRRKEPVSEAVFVTAILLALILPPTVPWHVVGVGMVVAIVFAKEVFGGFGRNVFNPAMVGRCFVYVCFPVAMTATWAPNAFDLADTGWYGALDRWTTQHPTAKPGQHANAYTGATPLAVLKERQLSVTRLENSGASDAEVRREEALVENSRPGSARLFLGNIRGTMGVTSALLILIGGLYLFITKTANRTIILSVIISCAALSEILTLSGVRPSTDWLNSLLGGGFLFGAFFMATDPISSAKTFQGRIVYGVIIGVGRVVIQSFSVFNGGLMFSLLLANMFAPSVDYVVRERAKAKKAKASAMGGTVPGEVKTP